MTKKHLPQRLLQNPRFIFPSKRWLNQGFLLCCILITIPSFQLFSGGSSQSSRPSSSTTSSRTSTGARIAQSENQLAIREITLFTSGVGQFTYTGVVEGDQVVQIAFSQDQLNDVLKSLRISDFDGGTITSVVYPGIEPLHRILQGYRVDLSANPSLAQLLEQLRGSTLEAIPQRGRSVIGELVGVESISPSGGTASDSSKPRTRIVMNQAGRLTPLILEDLVSVVVLDDHIRQDLHQALDTLHSRAGDDTRTLEIHFTGQGQRRVGISYVTEAPVWKTTFRIDSQEAIMQAWAIVENTTSLDWNNVYIRLVSGSPISFVQDLSTPQFIQRPVVDLTPTSPTAPPRPEAGIPSPAPQAALRSQPMAPAMVQAEALVDRSMSLADSGVPDSAAFVQTGESYGFVVTQPVSIPRRQSGLIPLFTQPIDVTRMSYFPLTNQSANPFAALWIRNTLGTRLPTGSVTVYEDGQYAGDAVIESFGPDEERIVAFARDQDIRIFVRPDQTQDISRISLARGVLIIERTTIHSRRYEVFNSRSRSKTLLLEYPRLANHQLLPLSDENHDLQLKESTESAYRFEVELGPQESRVVTLSSQEITQQTFAMINARTQTFLQYTTHGAASAEVRQALERAVQLRQAIDQAESRISSLNQARGVAVNNQARTRSNLESLGRESTQGQVFVNRLLELENEILSIDQALIEAREALEIARSWFDSFINELTVN